MNEQNAGRRTAKAFNEGSDARLAARPRLSNPYLRGDYCRDWWQLGWMDVDSFWGMGVQGRWRVDRLPPIQGLFELNGEE